MTDDGLGLFANQFMDHLSQMLGSAGRLHREAHAHNREKNDETEDHQQLQREGVVNGSGGIGGMIADQLQQRVHGSGKKVIQELRNG